MSESPKYRPCILIPTFDNPLTIRAVALEAREHLPHVLVVDDGSGPENRRAVDALEQEQLAKTRRRERNGGKGAAVQTGLRFARELGFTHAVG